MLGVVFNVVFDSARDSQYVQPSNTSTHFFICIKTTFIAMTVVVPACYRIVKAYKAQDENINMPQRIYSICMMMTKKQVMSAAAHEHTSTLRTAVDRWGGTPKASISMGRW